MFFLAKHTYYWFENLVITKKFIKVGKISEIYDILTVQETELVHIGNRKKYKPWNNSTAYISRGMAVELVNIRMRKNTEKEKNYLSDIGGKCMSEIMTGEA